MPRNHHRDALCPWVDREELDFMDHVDGDPFDRDQVMVPQRAGPRAAITIAPHRGDLGYGREPLQGSIIVNVPSVNDAVHTGQRGTRLWPQKTVGVGNHAESRHRPNHSSSWRRTARAVYVLPQRITLERRAARIADASAHTCECRRTTFLVQQTGEASYGAAAAATITRWHEFRGRSRAKLAIVLLLRPLQASLDFPFPAR